MTGIEPNRDQKDFWTHEAGPKWIARQAGLDALMQPVLDGVLSRAGLRSGQAVLDVGCGTGASALQAADMVGETGHVLGVDISDPMLAVARRRAAGRANLTLKLADAADHRFAPEFDQLISRFGVMFFADPVAAFANMARALNPGGRVTFAAWGQIPNNPFFTLPAQIARGLLGAPPKVDPDLPGPFAFRDPVRVIAILTDAGLADPACEVVTLQLTPDGTASQFADQLCDVGPAHGTLAHFQATPDQRAQVQTALTEALAPYAGPQGLSMPAEINFFTARI